MNSRPKTAPILSRRNLSLSLAAAVALVLGSQGAHAAPLTWDSNGNTADVLNGGGTWNTSNLNWWDGTQNVQWNNTTPESAIFGGGTGNGGTVTLGEDITVGNLTFNAPGYTLAGGGRTLTLSGTTITGISSATVSANLAGTTGLTITSASAAGSSTTLTLSGNNSYSGPSIISGSTAGRGGQIVRLNSLNALGNSDQITVGSGSGLLLGTGGTFGAGKTLTISGDGVGLAGAFYVANDTNATWAGTVRLDGNARVANQSGGTLTLSGPIQNGAAGNLLISVRNSGNNTGAVIVSGTQNTYTGATNIIRGTLRLGAHNALPTGTTLDVDSSFAEEASYFDLNGFNQTVAVLKRSDPAGGGGGSFITNSGTSTATLTINLSGVTPQTFSGILQDGTSAVALAKSGNGTLILTGANTTTGTTTVNGGTLQVSGAAGALGSANLQLNGGTLLVDNTGANNSNQRLGDAATLTLNGGTFHYKGSDQNATDSTETIGSINLGGGLSRLHVERGGTNTATLTAGLLTRATGGGVALINGVNLGSAGSADAARLMLTTAPTLVGGNTTATNKGIVPYLLGAVDGTTGAGTASTTPNTFLTYDPANGLRPLNPATEFTNGSIVAGDNIRLSGTGSATPVATANSTTAINSLILAGGSLGIAAGQTLTVTSGALLFTHGSDTTITGGTLDFANAEAVVTVNSGVGYIFSKITGSNGLSFVGNGILSQVSADSDYTGKTMLYSGEVVPRPGSKFVEGELVSGPFGKSTVVFAGSRFRSSGSSPSEITIGNNIEIQADTTFTSGGNANTVFSGPVMLKGGVRTLTTFNAKNFTFSGAVSGAEEGDGLAIAGSGPGSIILSSPANTYDGPTTVRSSTLNISGSIASSSEVAVHSSGTLILSGGTDQLGGLGRIGDDVPLTLGNADATGTRAMLKIDNSFDSSINQAPFEEAIGELMLASDAVIDLGTGSYGSILRFAESQGNLWTGTLHIFNWTGALGVGGGLDQIVFLGDEAGLTTTQLAQIIFYSDEGGTPLGSGKLLPGGEVVAVPEPSAALSLFAMLGGVLGGRRFRRKAKMEG